MSHICRTMIALSAIALTSQPAAGTAGFAEWEVLTPGGHQIAHSDRWKSRHGDCLVPRGTSIPVVSQIKRWRYYKNYVVGQTKSAFFVFNEKTKQVITLANKAALSATIKKKVRAGPLSDWYTGQDGWSEAWFPLLVWPRCKGASGQPPAPKALCDRFLSKRGLAVQRVTTWGQQCASMKRPSGHPGITAWCKLILTASKRRKSR